jgi:hypothetical protein
MAFFVVSGTDLSPEDLQRHIKKFGIAGLQRAAESR